MATSIVEVLWTARYDYEPGWTLSPHRHAFFQIIYCLGGRGTLTLYPRAPRSTAPPSAPHARGLAAEPHALAPRTLFLIGPAHLHGLVAASAVKTLDIKFRVRDPQLRRELLQMPAIWPRADKALAHLLERIRREGEQRQPFFREQCAASLVEILIALVRHSRGLPHDQGYPADLPEGALSDPVARRGVDYLHRHYGRPLTLRELSRVLGVGERHLRERVELALGQSPLRYLAQYRIDRAKDLIAHRELALKDVAARTGFKNIHHFTRTFARLVGMPPGAWRRAYADGIRRDVTIDPRFVNDLTPIAPSLSGLRATAPQLRR
jgi:AraC-like DNA-binding protein